MSDSNYYHTVVLNDAPIPSVMYTLLLTLNTEVEENKIIPRKSRENDTSVIVNVKTLATTLYKVIDHKEEATDINKTWGHTTKWKCQRN